MSFFNKKEDVLDIQLTKYGKELLVKGKFKPFYYSFFDKDVIYDARSYGLIETQNLTEDRIFEIPILRTQTNIEAIDKKSFGIYDLYKLNNSIGEPIGISDPNTQYAPAWSINFLSGMIKSVNTGATEEYNKYGDSSIPQINLHPSYFSLSVEQNYTIDLILNRGEKIELTPKPNGDGTYVKSKTEDVIVTIEEKNGLDIGDNFEIELFYVDHSPEAKKPLTKLNFYKFTDGGINRKIENDILLDSLEDGISYDETEQDRQLIDSDKLKVQLYFNVQSDNEISENELNALLAERLYIYDPITGRETTFGNSIDGATSGIGLGRLPEGDELPIIPVGTSQLFTSGDTPPDGENC